MSKWRRSERSREEEEEEEEEVELPQGRSWGSWSLIKVHDELQGGVLQEELLEVEEELLMSSSCCWMVF
jgi:hypothetical protein